MGSTGGSGTSAPPASDTGPLPAAPSGPLCPCPTCSLFFLWHTVPWPQPLQPEGAGHSYRRWALAAGARGGGGGGGCGRAWAPEVELELTQELHRRVQAEPALLRNASVLAAFRAAPWLLPRWAGGRVGGCRV